MPPIGKPLKDDGPACRCCGCTEHNACVEQVSRPRKRGTPEAFATIGCSWVPTEGATEPLCSACSGTEADAIEVLNRLQRHLKQHGAGGTELAGTMVSAALTRWRKRQRQNRG